MGPADQPGSPGGLEGTRGAWTARSRQQGRRPALPAHVTAPAHCGPSHVTAQPASVFSRDEAPACGPMRRRGRGCRGRCAGRKPGASAAAGETRREGGREPGYGVGPAASLSLVAGSNMKCLVTGGNVKGELRPAGGRDTWDGPRLEPNPGFSSRSRSARQGCPLPVPYRGRTLPGAPGRWGEGPGYWGRVGFQQGTLNWARSLVPIRQDAVMQICLLSYSFLPCC